MSDDIKERLRKLEIEEIVWGIYLIIIILSFCANSVERDFLINNNQESKNQYRSLQIIIFGIAIVIYLYFVLDNYKDILKLNENATEEEIKYTYLTFVSSLAILLSGLIIMYIVIKDKDVAIELAFN